MCPIKTILTLIAGAVNRTRELWPNYAMWSAQSLFKYTLISDDASWSSELLRQPAGAIGVRGEWLATDAAILDQSERRRAFSATERTTGAITSVCQATRILRAHDMAASTIHVIFNAALLQSSPMPRHRGGALQRPRIVNDWQRSFVATSVLDFAILITCL